MPVIRAVKRELDLPISVDTYKSKVAAAAIEAGADLVNDIWGLKYDPEMAGLIARTGTACCLMHNKNTTEYEDFSRICCGRRPSARSLQGRRESRTIKSYWTRASVSGRHWR